MTDLLNDFKNMMQPHLEGDYDDDISGYLYDWAKSNYTDIVNCLRFHSFETEE